MDTEGNVDPMNKTVQKVRHSTAPVPRGVCGMCHDTVKLSRETGRLTPHAGCDGTGDPTHRAATRDLRRTGTPVIPAPEGVDMIDRERVAEICGVTVRTVTRWATLGYLTKYEDSRGRVAYARVQAEAMNRFEPVE